MSITNAWTPSMACVCLLCLAHYAGATAQDVGPFVGTYVPLADVISEDGGSVTQQVGPAFGARGGYWLTPDLAVEGVAALGFATVKGRSGTTSAASNGRTLIASARGRWRPGDAGAAWPLFLSGGLSVISHGGEAFEPLTGTTHLGLVIGAGVERVMGERLRLRIDLEDNVYSARFAFGGEQSDGRLQNDVLVSIGLSFELSGALARRAR